jgi:hypothetical protein
LPPCPYGASFIVNGWCAVQDVDLGAARHSAIGEVDVFPIQEISFIEATHSLPQFMADYHAGTCKPLDIPFPPGPGARSYLRQNPLL